ncbi:MAG: GDP-mannose 4,6-dehydratase [Archangium sp.]|nr:GDP-mannose 4,6-dehydratase [Archangium sp.]
MGVVLITGVEGFVGAHLASLASIRGHQVVGVDRVGALPVDLLDRAALEALVAKQQPTHVLHLGGLLRSPSYQALYEVNVVGTANLLEAVVAAKLRPRIVVASSSAVYGTSATELALAEDRQPAPLTHYATSKLAQEAVALHFSVAHGLPIVVTRAFNVIGPGQPGSLAAGAFAEQVARAERSDKPRLETGDLTPMRDFVDVRDVAEALLAAADAGRPGETYNVCSGQPRPVSACVEALLARARVKIEVVKTAARSRTQDVQAQIGASGKLTAHTGWRPRITFEQSMNDLLDWWRQKVSQEGSS